MDSALRTAIIYDNVVHGIGIMNLVKKHHINYSTIRHILLQYQVSGKTDIRKYKLLEYNAAAGLNASEINFDILNSEASNESITSLEVLDGSAEIY